MEIQCASLGLSVPVKDKKQARSDKKAILQDIYASFAPGRLTAIMGASGAGKTSLLSVLSGDAPKDGVLSGEVLVDGNPISGRKMKKISGFVFQDDVLFDTMTVYEAIYMSAKLRLPDSVSDEEKKKSVENTIKLLGLEKARNTQIGTPERKGISGGERKRTSIAMEMVTNPAILFLDEPTSGLDTFTAYSVVKELQDLARTGRTVVATIHQPSSKTFFLFDDLLLLAEGRVVYHGTVQNVLNYMSALDYNCPPLMNPADFLFMEVLNEADDFSVSVIDSNPNKQEGTNQRLIEAWDSSEGKKSLLEKVGNAKFNNVDHKTYASPGQIVGKVQSSMATQFLFLSRRVLKNMLRNYMVLFVRAARSVAMGLLIASIYYDLPSKKGLAQTQDRVSVLFFLCTNELFAVMGNAIFLFAAERPVFLREYKNRYYSLFPYYASKVLWEIPLALFCPLLTVSIVFPLVGFRRDYLAFLGMVFTGQLVALVSSALGLMLGAMFSSFQVAMTLMPLFTLPMMIFGGVQINLDSIPIYFSFMPYISPLKWAFSSMAQLELRDLPFLDNQAGAPYPTDGNQVLKLYGLDSGIKIYQNWLVLLLMYFICTILGYAFLWRACRK